MSKLSTYNGSDPKLFRDAVRAGEMAQALFYAYLEHTWAYDLKSLELARSANGRIVKIKIIDGPAVDTGHYGDSNCPRYGGQILTKFPWHFVGPNDTDALHAVLGDHNSIWAFACMHLVVRTLFEPLVDDIDDDIKEVVHYVPNNVGRVIKYHSEITKFSRRWDRLYPDITEFGDIKAVYEVALKDGTMITLDLTNIAWLNPKVKKPDQPVMHVGEYREQWGNAVKYRAPLHSHYLKHASRFASYRILTHFSLGTEQSFDLTIATLKIICACKNGLQQIWDMHDDEFSKVMEWLPGHAQSHLMKRPRELDQKAYRVPAVSRDMMKVCTAKIVRYPSPTGSSEKTHDLEDAIVEVVSSDPVLPSVLECDVGPLTIADWDVLRRIVRMSSKEISLEEKKKAKFLLKHRCAYQIPGNWRLVFLRNTTPDARFVPGHLVSLNPYWKK